MLLSPYRCRDCSERFWVVGRHTWFLASAVGVAILVGALAWSVGISLDKRPRAPDYVAHDAARFTSLSKLADSGDPAAQFEVAMMYLNGTGVSRDETVAREWLELSAAQGHVAAQYELGLALRDGRGAIQDFEGAMKWISRAAEAGDGKAQFTLGIMYRLGTGTPADKVKAYTWLNLAAAEGVAGAAAARDSVRSVLSPAEIALGQAEARRLSAIRPGPRDTGTVAAAGCSAPGAGQEQDCPANAAVRR